VFFAFPCRIEGLSSSFFNAIAPPFPGYGILDYRAHIVQLFEILQYYTHESGVIGETEKGKFGNLFGYATHEIK